MLNNIRRWYADRKAEQMRCRLLENKLNGLVDPTLIERMWAGEQ